MKAYINGKIVDLKNARISVLDRGLLYGDGVFESIRTYDGKPFMIDEHLERLNSSARKIGLLLIKNFKLKIKNNVLYLLKLNGFRKSFIKIIVTRGEMAKHGLSPKRAKGKPSVIILVSPLKDLPASAYQKGWRAIISSIKRADNISARIKCLNYMDMMLAKREADKAGVEEAFVCDAKGNVLEATTSNVFVVKKGRLITPPLSAPILPGTIRGWVLKRCQMLNLKCQTLNLNLKSVLSADECFITNSGVGIMPIVKVNGKKIGNGKMGEITKILYDKFRKETKR